MLVVHISSNSVAAALVSFASGKKPVILASLSRQFACQDKPDSKILTRKALENLEIVLRDLGSLPSLQTNKTPLHLRRNHLPVSSALSIISSPWISARGKTVAISQERPFILTQRFLQSVVEKEIENFKRESTVPNSVEVLEHSIIGAKIRGYQVTDPLDQVTDQCDMSFYTSLVDVECKTKVAEVIEKVFDISENKIIFHSAPLVAVSLIDQMFHPLSALHIDVSGELTDVHSISSGVITHSISFPQGVNTLFRQIGKVLDVPHCVAESALRLYRSDRASEEMHRKVLEALESVKGEWAESMKKVFEEGLPSRIFLSAGDATAVFKNFLEESTVPIVPLDSETLADFVESKIPQAISPEIILDALFASKIA